MLPTFDPYHQWLGIPPAEQPPDHYRLLGISRFESDANVIASAADRQMAHVRTFQTGPHSAESQRLLNQLAAAQRTLLTPPVKVYYDGVLRAAAPADRVDPEAAGARPEPAASAPSSIPQAFGPYRVLERTSATALDMTFKVAHQPSGWLFSLKTLLPGIAKNVEVVKRFQREIDIVTKLNHPNLIAGVEAGSANGVPYLVTQYVLGTDLATLVKQHGPLPVDQALDYLAQAARGLTQLHMNGVYHRGLKPQILLVDMQGNLRVTNLLLARIDSGSELAQGEDLTRMGTMMGSADYLPPEQAVDARTADARSDIYALGCTLHFLLTGRPPFVGKSLTEKIMAHQRVPATPLTASRSDVPDWVEKLYQSMLAKNPAQRPQFMGDLVAQLERAPAQTWWQKLLASLGWKAKG